MCVHNSVHNTVPNYDDADDNLYLLHNKKVIPIIMVTYRKHHLVQDVNSAVINYRISAYPV